MRPAHARRGGAIRGRAAVASGIRGHRIRGMHDASIAGPRGAGAVASLTFNDAGRPAPRVRASMWGCLADPDAPSVWPSPDTPFRWDGGDKANPIAPTRT